MHYKAIFFDADGVILEGGHKFTDKLVEQYGLDLEKIIPFFHGPFQACAAGKADLKEALAPVLTDWGWTGSVDELVDFWLTEGTVFDEDTIALARDLKESGVPCFVTTGQEAYRGSFIRERVGGGTPFEDVYFSAEIGCPKTDPQFFTTCFSRVSHITTSPTDILVIDDSENIIDLAKELGFDTLFCKDPRVDLEPLRAELT